MNSNKKIIQGKKGKFVVAKSVSFSRWQGLSGDDLVVLVGESDWFYIPLQGPETVPN